MPANRENAEKETTVESTVRRATRSSLVSQSSPARPKRMSTVSATTAKSATKEVEGITLSKMSSSTSLRNTEDQPASSTKTKVSKVAVRKSGRSSRASSVEQSPSPPSKTSTSPKLSQITEESSKSSVRKPPKTTALSKTEVVRKINPRLTRRAPSVEQSPPSPATKSSSPTLGKVVEEPTERQDASDATVELSKTEVVRKINPRLTRRASSVEQSPPSPATKSSSPTLGKVVEEPTERQGASAGTLELEVLSTPKRRSRMYTSVSNVASPRVARRSMAYIPSSPVTPSRRSRRLQGVRSEDVPEPSKSNDTVCPSQTAPETASNLEEPAVISPKLRRSITTSGSPKSSPDRHAKCGATSPLALGTPVMKNIRRNSFSSPLRRSPQDNPIRTSPRLSVGGATALSRSPSPLLGIGKSDSPSRSKRSSLPLRSPIANTASKSSENDLPTLTNVPVNVLASPNSSSTNDQDCERRSSAENASHKSSPNESVLIRSEKQVIKCRQADDSASNEMPADNYSSTIKDLSSSDIIAPSGACTEPPLLDEIHESPPSSSSDTSFASTSEKEEINESHPVDALIVTSENQSSSEMSAERSISEVEASTEVTTDAQICHEIEEDMSSSINENRDNQSEKLEMKQDQPEVGDLEEITPENHSVTVENVSSSGINAVNKNTSECQSPQNKIRDHLSSPNVSPTLVSEKDEKNENQIVDTLKENTVVNQSPADESSPSKVTSVATTDTISRLNETSNNSAKSDTLSEIPSESPKSPDELPHLEENISLDTSTNALPSIISPSKIIVETSFEEQKSLTVENSLKLDSTIPIENSESHCSESNNSEETPTQELESSVSPINNHLSSPVENTGKDEFSSESKNEILVSETVEPVSLDNSAEVTSENSSELSHKTPDISLREDQHDIDAPPNRLSSPAAEKVLKERTSDIIPKESSVESPCKQAVRSNSPNEDLSFQSSVQQSLIEEDSPKKGTPTQSSLNKIGSTDADSVELSEQVEDCKYTTTLKNVEEDVVEDETYNVEGVTAKPFSENVDPSNAQTDCLNSESTVLDSSSVKSKDAFDSEDKVNLSGDEEGTAMEKCDPILEKGEELQSLSPHHEKVELEQDGPALSDVIKNVAIADKQEAQERGGFSPSVNTSPKRKSSDFKFSSPPKTLKKDLVTEETQEEGDFTLSIGESDIENDDNKTVDVVEKNNTSLERGEYPLDQNDIKLSNTDDASLGNGRHANALDDTFSIDSGNASEDEEKPRSKLELIEEVEEVEDSKSCTTADVSSGNKSQDDGETTKSERASIVILSDSESDVEAGVLDKSCFIVGDPTDYNKLGNYSDSEIDGSDESEASWVADSKSESNVESKQERTNESEVTTNLSKNEFASSAASAFVAKVENEGADSGVDKFASTSAGLFVATNCDNSCKRESDSADVRAAKKRRKENREQRGASKLGISVTICNIPGETSLQRLKGVLKEQDAITGLLSLQFRESKIPRVDSKFVTAVATYDSVKNLQKALSTYGKISINRHPLYFLIEEHVDKPSKKSPKKVVKFAGIISNLAPGVDIHEIASTLKVHGVEHLKNVKTYKPKSDGLFTARLEFRNKTALLKAVAVAENIRLGGRKINFKIKEKTFA